MNASWQLSLIASLATGDRSAPARGAPWRFFLERCGFDFDVAGVSDFDQSHL